MDGRIRELDLKCNEFAVHKKQLAEQRKDVTKRTEDLKPGQVIVIRDFVNHYDHSGGQVKCLIFVLLFKLPHGGPLEVIKLRNYCDDKRSASTDAYFVADCVKFHLSPKSPHNPGWFDDFKEIIWVGDHGPHFSSSQTWYDESNAWHIYGKEVTDLFLPNYHAFSRADGAGAEDVMSSRRDFKKGIRRIGAKDYTEMTNASKDIRSFAYAFEEINRGKSVFPPEKEMNPPPYIKKICEVMYNYEGRRQETAGVILYKLVVTDLTWQWHDLRSGGRDQEHCLCNRCSTEEQKLVYHYTGPKPQQTYVAPFREYCEPDSARLELDQVPRRKGRQGNKKIVNTFPCKYPECVQVGRKSFRSTLAANKHMRVNHRNWTDLQSNMYVDLPVTAEVLPVVVMEEQEVHGLEEVHDLDKNQADTTGPEVDAPSRQRPQRNQAKKPRYVACEESDDDSEDDDDDEDIVLDDESQDEVIEQLHHTKNLKPSILSAASQTTSDSYIQVGRKRRPVVTAFSGGNSAESDEDQPLVVKKMQQKDANGFVPSRISFTTGDYYMVVENSNSTVKWTLCKITEPLKLELLDDGEGKRYWTVNTLTYRRNGKYIYEFFADNAAEGLIS